MYEIKTQKHARRYYGSKGMVLLFSLFLMSLLMIIGTGGILYTSVVIGISGSFEREEQYSLLAEAGLEYARALLRLEEGSMDLVLGCFSGDDIACGSISGNAETLRDGLRFGEGICRVMVTVSDNDDGDGDPLSDADGIVVVGSTGFLDSKRMCSLEALIGSDPVETLAWREITF